MSDVHKVLIFPAGTEIGIEIFDALKYQKDIEVYGAASTHDHAEFIYERLACDLPFLGEPGLIEALNKHIDTWGIEFVYPARDDVQLFLVQHADELHARVVSAGLPTVEICRSKEKSYAHLAGADFVPRTFARSSEVESWPIFAKPAVGEGSNGARKVATAAQMDELQVSEPGLIFCEYLPGTEYSIDCLTDAAGDLKVCVPRTRLRVKTGISVRSAVVCNEKLMREAQRIGAQLNAAFEFCGAWFFQLKENADGKLVLLEVSPRVPGTMGLTRNLGVNYPLLTLYTMLDIPYRVDAQLRNIVVDKAFISRYDIDYAFDTVYIDYDDTLYRDDKVNWLAMAFLYQCKNKGKRVVMLTRHDDATLGPLDEHMAARGIAAALFDRIEHVTPDQSKADCIVAGPAIFIDDSFAERSAVSERCHIPVFDVGNIEALLDWRL